MNIKQLVAAITVLAATGAAFAEARPINTPFVSTKTRAEVRAELEQARAQGLLTRDRERHPVFAPVQSTRSREEVRAEAIEAMKHPQRNR